jgi:long-chain acyl-CoA synthetase
MKRSDYASLADVVRIDAGYRDAIALRYADQAYTYADLDYRSQRLASTLAQGGVGKGDRVALLARNGVAFFDTMFAVARLGAILVPINWRLSPTEVGFILRDCDPVAVVVDEDLAQLLPGKDSWRLHLTIREAGARIDMDAALVGTARDAPANGDDVALIVYTSGTTGQPKGAMISHANFSRHCGLDHPDVPGWYGINRADICLVALPLFHVGALELALRPLFTGATVVLHRDVDPARIVRDIVDFRVTMTGLVPTALQLLLDHPSAGQADFSRLRKFFYGAAPIPLGLLKKGLERMECDFLQSYGMTEASGTCSMLAPRDHDDRSANRLKSAGRPVPGVEMQVVDGRGEPLAANMVGEICVRGPGVMAGYWQKPDATKATIADNGWMRSGDAGYIDEDGFIYVVDRIKDMICTGGENVYPAEVEVAIQGHPQVAEVAVIGVPHPVWGESVEAVVVPVPGQAPSEADIIAWARGRIAAYKAPKHVTFLPALPRNAAGKVLRRELAARHASTLDKGVL